MKAADIVQVLMALLAPKMSISIKFTVRNLVVTHRWREIEKKQFGPPDNYFNILI